MAQMFVPDGRPSLISIENISNFINLNQDNENLKVICVIGPPGIGKSTFIRRRFVDHTDLVIGDGAQPGTNDDIGVFARFENDENENRFYLIIDMRGIELDIDIESYLRGVSVHCVIFFMGACLRANAYQGGVNKIVLDSISHFRYTGMFHYTIFAPGGQHTFIPEGLINNQNLYHRGAIDNHAIFPIYRDTAQQGQLEEFIPNGDFFNQLNEQKIQLIFMNVFTLTQQISNLQVQVNDVTGEKNNLQVQVNDVTGERNNLQVQVNDVTGERDNLQVQVNNLQVQVNNLQVQVNNLQVQVNDVTGERDNLQVQVNNSIEVLEAVRNYFLEQNHFVLNEDQTNLGVPHAARAMYNWVPTMGWIGFHNWRVIHWNAQEVVPQVTVLLNHLNNANP